MAQLVALYEKPEDAPADEAWVADLADALHQEDPGHYVNFLGPCSEADVRVRPIPAKRGRGCRPSRRNTIRRIYSG